MRKRSRRRQPNVLPILIVTAIALVIPVSVNYLYHHGNAFGRVGEKAAILAAAVNMPDGSLDLLRERFQSQLYDVNGDIPPAADAPPAQPEHSSPPQKMEDAPLQPEKDMQSSPVQPNPWPKAPKIPEEYAAPLLSENFSAEEDSVYVRFGAGYIRNDTKYADKDVLEIVEQPLDLTFADTLEPQVLIVHTHATESFETYDTDTYDTRNTWRNRDNNNNMVAVGAVMADILEQNGIGALHDTTQHDYPSYNGSYERSAETIKAYLAEYPSIKIVLDLHRDAMERENSAIVKPVAVIDGQKAAQIMIIAGCDNGAMNMPEWRQNLRFAAGFQSYMESAYPGLTRPVLFCYRKYNQDLTTGSLLLEFGSNANTLSEALYSAAMAGQALSDLIHDHTDWLEADWEEEP